MAYWPNTDNTDKKPSKVKLPVGRLTVDCQIAIELPSGSFSF